MLKKSKLSFHPKFTIPFLFVFALIAFWSCKKNNFLQQDHEVITKKVLSKDSPDFSSRLAAIKEKFYANKLDQKLIPNVKQSILWTPDWEHPSSQVVNDSVSYIFYRLKAYLKQDGKLLEAKEVDMATYLMVKNEKEFFKAFYYHPVNATDKSQKAKTFSIDNFTGNLLLKNLVSGKSFLLDYVNGTVSQSYNKRRLLAVNRQTINHPETTSYIETQCHTELRSCLFASDSPGFCSGIQIVSSPTCQWPPSMCGVTYSLIDSSEETVCEDFWFPDPPTDPGESGGSGGSGDGGTENFGSEMSSEYVEKSIVVDDGKKPIDPQKYIDCFNDGKQAQAYKMTLYVNQPIPGTNAQFSPIITAGGVGGITLNNSGELFDVGHTFVGFEKINTDGTSVKQFMGFYPSPGESSIKSKGVIKDDNGHVYNISYTAEVSKAQFDIALASVLNDSKGTDYVLGNQIAGGTEHNCTDAGIAYMTNGGVKLPADKPRGLFRNTPGDYGQALSNFSGANKTLGKATGGHGPCN